MELWKDDEAPVGLLGDCETNALVLMEEDTVGEDREAPLLVVPGLKGVGDVCSAALDKEVRGLFVGVPEEELASLLAPLAMLRLVVVPLSVVVTGSVEVCAGSG